MSGRAAQVLILLGACLWPVAVVVGVALTEPQVLVLALVLGLLVLVGLSVLRHRRHFLLGLFVAAFVLFLAGRHLLDLLWPTLDAVDSGLVRWTPALEVHVLLCLNLALIGLGVGALVAGHLLRRWLDTADGPPTHSGGPGGRQNVVVALRQVGLVLVAVSFPARFLWVWQVSRFVQNQGFYEIYVTGTSGLMPGVREVGEMNDVAAMAVLATRPGPRITWIVLGLYLLDGVASLATLQRATFFLNLLLVVVYLAYRQATRTSDEPAWLRPWALPAAGLALPALAAASQLILQQRGRYHEVAMGGPVRELLFTQGVSVNVVAFTKQFADQIPDGRWYSVGPIIEFVRYRALGTLTGESSPVGNTPERALEGNLFSHTVSYLAIPDVYVRGSGYGSSFVAELYVDLGYPGVLVGSALIGALTVVLTAMLRGGLVTRLLALLMIRQLFFIPRGSFSGFLVNAFDSYNLMALTGLGLGVWLLVSHRARQRDDPGAGPRAAVRRPAARVGP